MQTPDQIIKHDSKYNNNAWQDYSIQELGQWVHLLAKRATMRADADKRRKDLTDARNYWLMIGSHLDSLDK